MSIPAYADTQRVIKYEYDDAGNITGIRTGLNLGPPDVTALTPAFVNKESFNIITATGINLAGATVETSTPGLSILNFNVLSETEITITVRADESAVTGPGLLTFSTRLGEDTESIVIAERTPVISTEPNPVILEVGEEEAVVSLLFDEPFPTDETYDLAVTDSSIATVTEQDVTLPAGSREVQIHLSGIAAGNTTLQINQLSNFLALGIPVIVLEEEPLPPGDQYIVSRPTGVLLRTSPDDLPVASVSSRLGVLVSRVPESFPGEPVSSALGVLFTESAPTSGTLNPVSNSVGVLYIDAASPEGTAAVFSDDLGLALAPYADGVTPSQVMPGSSHTLTIPGASLDQVTAVSFSPVGDITQTAPFTVSPDGTELSIFIDVSAGAATGQRQIILETVSGRINFTTINGEVLFVSP